MIINLFIQSILLILFFIFTLIFAKEGFGIKLEIFFALILSVLPLLVSLILSISSFYNEGEKYFPALFFFDFAIINFNFFTITVPILKSYFWKNKKNKLGLSIKNYDQNITKDLMKELIEGKDPNSDNNYIHLIIENPETRELFKDFSKREFSVENVKLIFYKNKITFIEDYNEIKKLEKIKMKNEEMKNILERFREKYFDIDSIFEINLDSEKKK
jgi:hypothetical protein